MSYALQATYKCQNAIPLNTIELIFHKELMLIKQMHQKNVIFVIAGILKVLVLSMNHIFPYGCHDLLQKAMSFNDVAIVYVKGSAYRIHFWYMSKDDAISIMNNSNLIVKKGVL